MLKNWHPSTQKLCMALTAIAGVAVSFGYLSHDQAIAATAAVAAIAAVWEPAKDDQ